MGDNAFDEKSLTEKLSKLNSSQQSIESLSKWCVSHRKKAKQVVEKWESIFKSAQKEQQVSFLYLANDILQNSRRQGSEYVNEFWKVLPSALKGAYDSGHQSCRKVVLRLVDIWEERKVFGSRSQNLKNEIVGKNPFVGKNSSPSTDPSPVNNIQKPNPIKVMKRDANSLRIKLAVGCFPEKILTSFHLVHDEIVTEEGAFTKCKDTVSFIQDLEKDVVTASSQGILLGSEVVDDILKHEDVLRQCINQLENSEAKRVSLVSQLKEALEDQESKTELIRNEIIVAKGLMEQAANIRLRFSSLSTPPPTMNQLPNLPLAPPTHPSTSLTNSITEEVNTKATAAAMAAKLASSTSSAQMLTSILSSLVAEEAASMSSGLKRQKLDNPSSEGTSSAYFATTQQSMTILPCVSTNQLQPLFLPPPPPALAPPASSPVNQLGVPYGFGTTNLSGLIMPGPPAQQAQPQQALPMNGGFYRPVGIGFYGRTHQPSTPPIHRQ